MTVHKHAAILKAYADDTDLVIFIRDLNSKWIRTNPKALMDYPDDEFFACLPQHKEACLHWLNGGTVQVKYECDHWKEVCSPESLSWHGQDYFMMRDYVDYRIKPRKEKRWICITEELEIEDGTIYESYADADENSPGYKQIIEIEVEV